MHNTETTAPTKRDEQSSANSVWRSVALFLLTVSGISVCVGLIHVLLVPLTGAVVLAVALRVPHLWLRRHLGPAASSAVLIGALCLAVVLPGFFVVRSLTGEVGNVIQYVQGGAADRDFHRLTAKHQKIGRGLQEVVDQVTPDDAGRRIASQAALLLGRGLQEFVRGVTEVVLLLFFVFFFLRDQDKARQCLSALVPLGREETEDFLSRLSELTYAVFAGRLVIAAIQGTLAGLGYWVLGVPGALLWAVLTALLCLIPAFGAFLAWIPIALYLGLADSWTKALILAIWGGLVVGNIDNVLYPILVGRRTSLHPAVVFVAIFGGVALFGISGFVIGPVSVSATLLLLQAWKKRLDTQQGADALP